MLGGDSRGVALLSSAMAVAGEGTRRRELGARAEGRGRSRGAAICGEEVLERG